jgi:hypothetical protein
MHARILSLSLVAVLAAGAFAQKGHLAPNEAKQNAARLLAEIAWHDDLNVMLRKAREEDKLVFYMHMLGDIRGDT